MNITSEKIKNCYDKLTTCVTTPGHRIEEHHEEFPGIEVVYLKIYNTNTNRCLDILLHEYGNGVYAEIKLFTSLECLKYTFEGYFDITEDRINSLLGWLNV